MIVVDANNHKVRSELRATTLLVELVEHLPGAQNIAGSNPT